MFVFSQIDMKNIDAYNVCLLIFPFNSPQACREFGSVCSSNFIRGPQTILIFGESVEQDAVLYKRGARSHTSLSLSAGNLCDYVDRAWCYSFLARFACKVTKKI